MADLLLVDLEDILSSIVDDWDVSVAEYSENTLASALEEMGFLVENPTAVLEEYGVDTIALLEALEVLEIDAGGMLASLLDTSVPLDDTIYENFNARNPWVVLDGLDMLAAAFESVQAGSVVAESFAAIDKAMKGHQVAR